MSLARLEDLLRPGADETVSADELGGGALKEERVVRLRVGRDLEVCGGGGDEVGGDLRIDGDEVRCEGGIGRGGEDFSNDVERRQQIFLLRCQWGTQLSHKDLDSLRRPLCIVCAIVRIISDILDG